MSPAAPHGGPRSMPVGCRRAEPDEGAKTAAAGHRAESSIVNVTRKRTDGEGRELQIGVRFVF